MTIKVSKPAINLREKLNELDFDRVPFQKMPAGSVVRVVSSPVSRTLFYSQSTIYAEIGTNYRVTLTPVSSSSTFILAFNTQVNLGTNTFMGFNFMRSTDGGSNFTNLHPSSANESFRNSNSSVMSTSATFSMTDAPNHAGSLTYTVFAARPTGSSNARLNDNGMGTFLTVTEIAG